MDFLKKTLIFFIIGSIQGALYYFTFFLENTSAATLHFSVFICIGILISTFFLASLLKLQKKLKLGLYGSIGFSLFAWSISCMVMIFSIDIWKQMYYQDINNGFRLTPGWGLGAIIFFIYFHTCSAIAVTISVIVRFIRFLKDKNVK